jgi:hypothetical protein
MKLSLASMPRTQKGLLFLGFVAAAVINLAIFGFPHPRSWGDAQQYDAYAINLLSNHNYSINGSTFSAFREPGYPALLATVYSVFGVDNFTAVSFVQAFLVGLLAFVVYFFFSRIERSRWGLVAGFAIALFPYYGFYSAEILTETLFSFWARHHFLLCVSDRTPRERRPYAMVCATRIVVRSHDARTRPVLIHGAISNRMLGALCSRLDSRYSKEGCCRMPGLHCPHQLVDALCACSHRAIHRH